MLRAEGWVGHCRRSSREKPYILGNSKDLAFKQIYFTDINKVLMPYLKEGRVDCACRFDLQIRLEVDFQTFELLALSIYHCHCRRLGLPL
jgi:hypothetical protein